MTILARCNLDRLRNWKIALAKSFNETVGTPSIIRIAANPICDIFVGKPGVGKTLTARWLASKLRLPLYILDLTTATSSLLGKRALNLRAALDFSKQGPCVLLLDEIDAIASKCNDDTDIGELKRLADAHASGGRRVATIRIVVSRNKSSRAIFILPYGGVLILFYPIQAACA